MFCDYDCGQEANYQLKNGKWCCSKSQNSCIAVRKKMSDAQKEAQNRLEVKTKMIEVQNSREVSQKKSKSQRETCSKLDVKEKMSKAAIETWKRTEVKEKRKQNMNKPEVKERKIRNMKISLNTPQVREKKSKSQRETCSKLDVKEKMSKVSKEVHNRPEIKEKSRQRMLDGQAVYMQEFIKNPSKPQVELFKMLQQLCPNPIMNYPIFYRKKWNYSIDIADPKIGLAFEYDEPYWHKHKGRDSLRQRRIEELGWKFLRYEKLPTLEQLKNDIMKKECNG